MKIIEAYLKLYNDKDQHTNGKTNGHSGDVDNSVIPVMDQTSECGFEIVFKHESGFMVSALSFSNFRPVPAGFKLIYSVLKLLTGFTIYNKVRLKKISGMVECTAFNIKNMPNDQLDGFQ